MEEESIAIYYLEPSWNGVGYATLMKGPKEMLWAIKLGTMLAHILD